MLANAQVSGYTFSQTTSTYTPLTGGTRVGGSIDDSQVYGSLPIGFSFVYNSVSSTQFGLNANGWISLGSATPTNSSTPISSGSTNNIISAMAADLVGGLRATGNTTSGSNQITNISDIFCYTVGDTLTGTGIPTGTTITAIDTAGTTITLSANATSSNTASAYTVYNGRVYYQTLGTSPNQTLVVEFRRYRRFAQSNNEMDFQIILHETTNVVEIVYGNCRQLAANTTTNTLQVGLRGNSTADFNNRTTATDWSATIAGAVNSSTCTFKNGVVPAQGLTFRWSPPTCFSPTALTVTYNGSDSVRVKWNAPVQGTPQSYQYVVVPQGNNVNTGVVATGYVTAPDTSAGISGLSPGTSYSIYVRSICGAGDSSAYTVATNVTTHCTPISAPWTQSFENPVITAGYPNPPQCWQTQLTTGAVWQLDTTAVRNSIGARSGNNYMRSRWSSDTWLFTPGTTLTAGVSYDFSFWYVNTDVTNPGLNITVKVGSDNTAAAMNIQLGALVNTTNTTYSKFVASFVPQSTGVYYFGVHDSTTSSTPWYFLTDDYALILSPTCSGTPSIGQITGVDSACSGVSDILTLSSASIGAVLQWQSSPDSITWTDIAGANASNYTASITALTYYRVRAVCTDTVYTNAFAVRLVSPIYCYCTPASTNCNSSDVITNVTFAGLNVNSTCSTNGYSYTTTPVASAYQGVTYPISVTVGPGGTEYVSVWIDYNQNGAFEASEYTYLGSANGATISSSITIPSGALLGTTRMRIRVRFNTQLGSADACLDGFTYGETEDYLINIQPQPACTNPPVAGTITGALTTCGGAATTLQLNGQTLGTTTQWQSSADSTTWADISGATGSAYTTPGVTGTTYYRVKVTCVDSAFTPVVKVMPSPFYMCTCVSGIGGFCSGTEVIQNVNITTTTLNNSSACPVATGNGDYYTFYPDTAASTTATLYQTVMYTLNVNLSNASIVSVWIDYNQNGVYEASEWTQVTTNGQNPSVNITIPANALLGKTGMRIRSRATGNSNGSGDACSNFGSGETEDYVVTIATAPPCITPPVGGVASGPASATTDSVFMYVLTGSTGTITWQYSIDSATGPFTNIANSDNDTLLLTFNGGGIYYVRAFLSSPGCSSDSSNAVQTSVIKLGDNVCDAFLVTVGTNGPYNTAGATVQTGETAPPGLGCGVQNGWCATNTLSQTLWFKFAAPASGRVSIGTPGSASNYDTQLALWDANACGDLLTGAATLLYANDDDANYTLHGGGQFSSFIDSATCLTPGKFYYIQLDPYSTSSSVTTNVVITDLGPGPDAGFTGLDNVYCSTAPAVTLTPATPGGTFSGTGVTGSTFNPATAGVGGPYAVTYTLYACYAATDTVSAVTASPTLTSTVTDVQCYGGADGAIDLTATGGTPSYNFAWSNGANTEDLSGLTAGTYVPTCTDANGCSATASITVNQPDAIAETVQITDVSCYGLTDGVVDVTITGGTTPYTSVWTNGATSEDLSALGGGVYQDTVTDAHGCVYVGRMDTVNVPDSIAVTLDGVTNVSCAGGNNGEVMVTVTGGVSPYTFNWSDGSTNEDVMNATAGTYTGTGADNNGCPITLPTATVTEPDSLMITSTFVNPSCNGSTNGSIDITVTGGVAPYAYAWTNNATTEDLSNLAADVYRPVVTDDNGCVLTGADITLTEPAAIAVGVDSVVNAKCNGATNGGVFISVTGGTTPYTYLWNNNATTQDISGVAAGSYSVGITDANGCTFTSSANSVTEPNALSATSVSTNEIQGGAKGAIDVTVTGGTPAYVYHWNNNATTQDLTNLSAGTYNCTITDANGCTFIIADTVDLINGITDIKGVSSLAMYPNPSKDVVTISAALVEASDISVDVYTINGQLVNTYNKQNVLNANIEMNFANEAEGVYVAKITIAGNSLTKRIVITR